MKKYLLICLIFVLSIFVNVSVNADSTFTSSVDVPTDITENQIRIRLGFMATENMIVMEDLKYDSRYLEYDSLTAGEYFNITVSEPTIDGNYKTIRILGDSNYAFQAYNYVELVFNVQDKFKKGAETDIVVSNIKGLGLDKEISATSDRDLYLHRINEGVLDFKYVEITSSVKFEMFMRKNVGIIIIIIVVIVILIIILSIIKRQQKLKNRKDMTVSQEELMATPLPPQNQNINTIPEQVTVQPQVVEQPVPQPVVTEQPQPVVEEQPVATMEMSNTETAFGIQSEQTASVQPTPVAQPEVVQDNSMASIFANSNDAPMEMPAIKAEQPVAPVEEQPVVNAFDIKPNVTNNDQNNTPPVAAILFVLLTGIFALSPIVKAEEIIDNSNYDVDGLRTCLVNNNCSTKYDYNSDNVVNLLDLLATKDLSHTSLPVESGGTGHGFETIIINNSTTTKKTKSTKSTASKKTTSVSSGGGTTKVTTSSGSGGGGFKTTKAATTKATTTKAAAASKYSIKVVVKKNGGSSSGTQTKAGSNIASGGSWSSDVSYSGYNFAGITCNNGANGSYEGSKIIVSNITANTECTTEFNWDSKVSVAISVSNGKASESNVSIAANQTGTVSITPNTGYSCENATINTTNDTSASLGADCTLSIRPSSSNSRVSVVLSKIVGTYYLSCGNASGAAASASFGAYASWDITSSSQIASISCGGVSGAPGAFVTVDGGYRYKAIRAKVEKKSETCTCTYK